MFKRDFLVKSNFNIKQALNYNKAYDKIIELNLFDENFYSENYSQFFTGDALKHYLFEGYKKNFDPSAKFSTKEYINKNPDVKKSNLNPLVHYVLFGKNEGKKIYPSKLIKKEKISNRNLLCLHNYKFKNEPLVSIIVLNRNGINHLKVLFKDFSKKTNYSNFEFILVDNDSNDNSVSYAKSLNVDFPLKIIENNENLSFSEANNQACEIANGEYLLLLNNDIEPTYGWLNEMMGTMLNNKNIGSVGAKLVYPNMVKSKKKSFKIQHCGDIFSFKKEPLIYAYHHNELSKPFNNNVNHLKKVISATAAVLLVKKSVYQEVGGLDERYVYGWEDLDFSMKLHQKGYDILYCPSALLFHNESSTRTFKDKPNINAIKFNEKWNDYLNKHIYLDKINNNKFFCQHPLKIMFIIEDIDKLSNNIIELYNILSNENYDIDLSTINNIDDDYSIDIIVSFTPKLNFNLKLRDNIIKVACFSKNNADYDLTINNVNEFKEKLIEYVIKKYD